MKHFLLFTALFIGTLTIKSQNYQINFIGQGESTSVDSVFVENITQNTNLKIGGGDILKLVGTIGINDESFDRNQELNIYPNPFSEYCNVEFLVPVSGNVLLNIYDNIGRVVMSKIEYFEQGYNKIQLSGINSGVYFLQISSKDYSTQGKLISNSNVESNEVLLKSIKSQMIIDLQNVKLNKEDQIKSSTIEMQYNEGDRLKFTGMSGVNAIYKSIFMLIPTTSQTITFSFYLCVDPDENHYSTVEIGTQIWMAENLRYLPSVVGSSTGSPTTPYYYVFGYEGTNIMDAKNTTNYIRYGTLYNWAAAMIGSSSSTANPSGVQGICPTNWHLPSDAEWTELVDYLDGQSEAGGKLKETGTNLWISPNYGATNETGFTALPGSGRNELGAFYNTLGEYGLWWSTTQNSDLESFRRNLFYNSSTIYRFYDLKEKGFSVRCVKD
jgi:uncharacterized protein (TIGR02145 family)